MNTARLADAGWLTGGALAKVLGVLNVDGEEARVVGGAVRNALLAEPVQDVDIATTALPDEIMRRATAAGFRPVPTGIAHGTVTIVAESQPFEVTTLREDVETYGRKAKVAFGRDWKRDAERRDFTMNALSASCDGTVHDYVGGLADLRTRTVRFIGDPARRIEEDYLRILRFFRFHAAYGGGEPDRAALSACIAGREGLASLSRERIRAEMLKLMVTKRVGDVAGVMADAGLLTLVTGGVPLPSSLEKMSRIEASLDLAADPVRRLGALSVSVREDAERLLQRLRLGNGEFERLSSMADGWWRITPDMAAADARALLYRAGPQPYVDRVLLAWSRSQDDSADPRWTELAKLPERWAVPVCPVSARDLMARGIEKGPALGAALRAAEAAWIAADFPDDEAAIAALADRAALRQP